MSNFLAVDTSSRSLTVLAVKGEKIVLHRLEDCAMRHSVVLMGEIDRALKEARLTPAECDFFSAVTGPGSFTGIRIGISTAKGFAVGADKPLVSVTSFQTLAYNVTDENFCTVIDAMHGCYYVCGFNQNREVTLAPSYRTGEEIESFGVPLYGFEELPLKGYRRISPDLYAAVKANESNRSREMRALYVRKSQAEEARGEV